MIALEFTGVLADNAHTTQENGKIILTFPVIVTRHIKQSDGTTRTMHTHILCRKTGAFAVDARFRKGQAIFIRGDISIQSTPQGQPQLCCNAWQFELL